MRRRTKKCRRGKRGGAMAPLDAGAYPGSASGGQWSTSVGGNSVAAAANAYKPFLSQFSTESGGAGVDPDLARQLTASYAMTGAGQTGGGSRRHKRHHKRGKRHGSKRMRMSQSQDQSQSQSEGQSGGMFATFGALLKEALVPLGLLAAQQVYGKSYGKKHRSSKNYTRKRR